MLNANLILWLMELQGSVQARGHIWRCILRGETFPLFEIAARTCPACRSAAPFVYRVSSHIPWRRRKYVIKTTGRSFPDCGRWPGASSWHCRLRRHGSVSSPKTGCGSSFSNHHAARCAHMKKEKRDMVTGSVHSSLPVAAVCGGCACFNFGPLPYLLL